MEEKAANLLYFNNKRSSYLGVLNNSTNAGALILNVTRYHGLSKKLEENPQKLEDALKVMEILSSVEGTTAVYDESKLKSSLLPFKDWNADDTYYGDIADEINAGNTVPLIYAGGKYIGKYRKPYAGIHSGSGNA